MCECDEFVSVCRGGEDVEALDVDDEGVGVCVCVCVCVLGGEEGEHVADDPVNSFLGVCVCVCFFSLLPFDFFAPRYCFFHYVDRCCLISTHTR